ncbi:MAG TPA: sigma-70 family RNA polymerase sigma factor, partial [Terriglobales bacterium]|nr:sigma-70 family RNA polymerase sigma factor [Terriglobales bacterium]
MAGTTQSAVSPEIRAAVSARLDELFARSGAISFGITKPEFEGCLQAIAAKYLPSDTSRREAEEFVSTLRVEEIVLTRACVAGNERAWEQFMARFRELLYDSALGIAKEASQAKDLADSLYADLYGLNERDGTRVSKLASYMGRGSLEGWLRTVVAQEFVNRYRAKKRLVSLEEEEEEGSQYAAPDPNPAAPVDPRVNDAISDALATLDSESRTILSAYYLDGRKMAEIGRMLGFH